jgi:hypothetical protein
LQRDGNEVLGGIRISLQIHSDESGTLFISERGLNKAVELKEDIILYLDCIDSPEELYKHLDYILRWGVKNYRV